MKDKNNFNIFIHINKDNTSITKNISEYSVLYLLEKEVLELS
jgi:hypothetical protein